MKQITIPLYLLYGLLVAILLISAIFFFGMKDGNQCIGNPLLYGAEKASGPVSGDLTCSCGFSNPSYARFYFDKDNMSVIEWFSP